MLKLSLTKKAYQSSTTRSDSTPMLSNEGKSNKNLLCLSKNSPQISIVVPAYNEDGNLRHLYNELMEILPGLNKTWEIVFVDDGSTDRTWETIVTLSDEDKAVRGFRFSRNFGHQYALFAGLSHAAGKVIITMDADLQHPPQLIPELIEAWENGSKIVHTVRSDPEDFSPFKKIASKIFYKIFSFCAGVQISSGMADFRLLDRAVLYSILQFRENGLFLRGIAQWVGYPSSSVRYQSSKRFSGTTHYTWKKMIRFAWHGISSFSIVPLRIAIVVGLLTSGIAFLYLVYAFYAKFATGAVIAGWTSTVSVVSFLMGIMFILLGLIGEYIGRILIEVMQRPRYLISEQTGGDEHQ